MTHADAIRAFRAAGAGRALAAAVREEAIDHVVRCSECWGEVAHLHETLAGRPPEGADRAGESYGCDDVRGTLHLVTLARPAEALRAHPAMARHLAWCLPCRELLADVLLAEHAVAAGEVEPFAIIDEPASWRTRVASAGEAVHELAGSFVVQVRRTLAGFAAAPPGVEIAAGCAGAMRGAATDDIARQAIVALADSGLVATIDVDGHGNGLAQLTVAVADGPSDQLSAELRADRGTSPALLAAQPLDEPGEAAFREVPPGDYLLDIRTRTPPRRYRIRLHVAGDD